MLALVVDDSRTMRSILRRTLRSLDYDTVEAENGAEALAVLESGVAPDVCLIDWNMPVLDGLGFIHAVKQRPHWRHLVLMMVTSEAETSAIVRALAAGAHEYLVKPFTADAIADKLQILGLPAHRTDEVPA